MKKNIISLIAFFGLLIIISCSDNSTKSKDGPIQSKDLIPLKIGNYWKYKIRTFDKDSNQIRFDNDELVIEQEIEVFGDTTIDGEKFYGMDHWIDRGKYQYFANKDDGVYGFQDNFELGVDSISLYYKYPAFVSDKYNVNGGLIEIISTNEAVKVPVGEFNCIVYKITDKKGIIVKFYISPGTGYVKIYFNGTALEGRDLDNIFIWELVDKKL